MRINYSATFIYKIPATKFPYNLKFMYSSNRRFFNSLGDLNYTSSTVLKPYYSYIYQDKK